MSKKSGVGQSGQVSYVASISDLLDFCKFNRPPASVLQNFAVTEVYVKRARKCLAKDMRSNWITKLDIETLESRRSWATLSEVQSVIPFHEEHYKSVSQSSSGQEHVWQEHVWQEHVWQEHVWQEHVWQEHVCQDTLKSSTHEKQRSGVRFTIRHRKIWFTLVNNIASSRI